MIISLFFPAFFLWWFDILSSCARGGVSRVVDVIRQLVCKGRDEKWLRSRIARGEVEGEERNNKKRGKREGIVHPTRRGVMEFFLIDGWV